MTNPPTGPTGASGLFRIPVGFNGPAGVSMSSSHCLLKFKYEDVGWLTMRMGLHTSHAIIDLDPSSTYAPPNWEKKMESKRFKQVFQITFVDDYLKFSNVEKNGKVSSFELHGDKPTIKQARVVKKKILEIMEHVGLIVGLKEAKEKFKEEPLKDFLTDVVHTLRTAEVIDS